MPTPCRDSLQVVNSFRELDQQAVTLLTWVILRYKLAIKE
jgi:hypothetical protein